MDGTLDDAYKIGCGRLLFEHGALLKLGSEALRFGKRAFLLGGPHAMAQVQDRLLTSLSKSEIETVTDIYAGPCSEEKAQEIVGVCRERQLDVLIGAGGGRIMDLIKIAAALSGLPVITIPCISATCAAYTPLSVVYARDGACRGTWYFRREVDCVLCDLDVLCGQNPRYLAAGILDAMAKHVEITHHEARQGAVGQDVLLARLLARTLYDDLMAIGLRALSGEQAALERCIFHTLITTGIISGIARGQYQSAVAHAVYEAIRTLYTVQSRPWLHGEVVAVGLILQARYLGRTDMAENLLRFMREANMPTSLSQIGVCGDVAELASQPPVRRFYLNGEGDARILAQIMETMRQPI